MKIIVFFLAFGHVVNGFNICLNIVAGTCGWFCRHEVTHVWNLPMCHGSTRGDKCCITVDHPFISLSSTSNSLPTVPSEQEPSRNTAADSTAPQSPQGSCGVSRRPSRRRRVVGGSRAPSGAWPWMVALRSFTSEYICGGVIVADRWVLTAAHCFQQEHRDEGFVRVYVGSQTLSFAREGRSRTVQVARIVKHENYQSGSQSANGENDTAHARPIHDIALLELVEPLNITAPSIGRVCLPEESAVDLDTLHELESSEDCWVTGWGESTDGQNSLDLQEVRGRVVSHRDCSDQWQVSLSEKTVCFGDQSHGPCQGDSGGPLTCRHNGKHHLVGIVSWGRDDCQHTGFPSVFTRVYAYLDWIRRYID